MRRKLTIQSLFIVFVVYLSSMVVFTSNAQEAIELQEMIKSFNNDRAARSARIEAYLKTNKSANRTLILDNDRLAVMYDIINGLPEYTVTYNKGAAETLGTNQLHSGGNLGLNLTGNGIKIGVWDGGYARESHQEYIGRILTSDGNEFGISNHATHVMGTILASGVNTNAKGMAPQAIGLSYGFNSDLLEMTAVALTPTDNLILSNHSYGTLAGWNFNNNAWTWFGDASISEDEDWKFGFYNATARDWDDLAHKAPFYTIVKSAGNDRSDAGNGTRPADGPFDIISTYGTAKNIITVGAVQKINGGYDGLNSVVMSSFSGWGPTDDGRIKPDIVGAGVAISSAYSSADDAYGNLQGTSMSAPNVTGSIALLQELHSKLNGGQFMRSATVKSLIFHTANEAGAVGPDYIYGWGVMNTEAAARLLLQQNGFNKVIKEVSLNDGDNYELLFTPKENTEVKATIVWTDLPGSPPPVSLDPIKLMLVNDLDMRISDGTTTHLPWILDPSNPGAGATLGDNFRDNSEQIVFTPTSATPQRLVVSHKFPLSGGSQRFSIILTYESATIQSSNYYWIGKGGGSWTDPSNWSNTSGGAVAGTIPSANDLVFFDENSFDQSQNKLISIAANQEVGTLVWLSSENVAVNMNNSSLKVNGDLILSNELVSISNGTIILGKGNSSTHRLVQNGVDLTGVNLVLDANDATWNLLGSLILGDLNIISGNLAIENSTVTLNTLSSTATSPLNVSFMGSTLDLKVKLDISNPQLSYLDEGSTINIPTGQQVEFIAGGVDSKSTFNVKGELSISGTSNVLDSVSIHSSGILKLKDDIEISSMTVSEAGNLILSSGKKLDLINNFVTSGNAENPVVISNAGSGNAVIQLDGHRVICLDFLSITNVDFAGTASITTGVNSTLVNANNWQNVSCENVLFPDFAFDYTCQNALTTFTDNSTGAIDSWEWNFGDGATSTDQNPVHQYLQTGAYNVTLVVKAGDIEISFVSTLEITENSLNPNSIVNNDGVLASQQSAASFQWYKDGVKIEGATARTFDSQNIEGTYFVVTFNSDCSLKSSDFVLLVNATDDEIALINRSTRLYPNPSNKDFEIDMVNDYFGKVQIEIIDMNGKSQLDKEDFKNSQEFKRRFDSSKFSKGIYLIKLSLGSEFVVQKKLIIN